MVPRPPPHPQLGEHNCHEAKTTNGKPFLYDSHVSYFKNVKMIPKWSQHGPPRPPPHPRLGNKKNATKQKQIETNTFGIIFMYTNKKCQQTTYKYNTREHTY